MKPTLRRNGKHMVTLRIEHHIDLQFMVAALVKHQWHEAEDELPESLSAARIEKIIREELSVNGKEQALYWGEEVDDLEDLNEWATQQILHHWSQLGESK